MYSTTSLINFIVTGVIHLVVPVCIAIRGKIRSSKELKTIAIINGIVLWVLFVIMHDGDSDITFATIAWSYIGYLIMERRCYKKETDNNDCNSFEHENKEIMQIDKKNNS